MDFLVLDNWYVKLIHTMVVDYQNAFSFAIVKRSGKIFVKNKKMQCENPM